MPDATFARPDLTTFCGLDELGLEVVGQRLETDRAVVACRVVGPDDWCRRCGCQGAARDTVTRRLAHEPFGWRPTTLAVTVRRYRCVGCGHVWRQDTSKAERQRVRLDAAFAGDAHLEVEATWAIYQRIVASYRNTDPTAGKTTLKRITDSIGAGVPAALPELRILGRTLNRRATDILAYFKPARHLQPDSCQVSHPAAGG